jgi:xanthine dehydrogenase YagT iron-sulfur-binding subunit
MAKRKDEPGFSRRSFLKTVSASGVAAGVLSKAPDLDAQAASGVGPGPVPVTLNVNGQTLRLEIEPRVTLLDALRMRADQTGNKRGCDRGACGACTMLVDGRPVYACSTLAIDVQGKRIRNVDGLASASGELHPVQQAFCEKDALMCGFCTPGFVMASVGLLEKHPNPTPDQIKKGLDGNICRCGTFNRIFEAVSSVSARGQRASLEGSPEGAGARERVGVGPHAQLNKGVQRG